MFLILLMSKLPDATLKRTIKTKTTKIIMVIRISNKDFTILFLNLARFVNSNDNTSRAALSLNAMIVTKAPHISLYIRTENDILPSTKKSTGLTSEVSMIEFDDAIFFSYYFFFCKSISQILISS